MKDNYEVQTLNKYEDYVDANFSSDVTILINNRFYYIHIVKDSKTSRSHLKDKAKKESYIKNKKGRKCYWYINWNEVHIGHHQLLYDESDPQQTELINDIVVFRDEYLKQYFDNLFDGDEYDIKGESEIEEFYAFLIDSGLN